MKGKIVYGSPIRYFLGGKEVSREEFDNELPDRPICTMRGVSNTPFNHASEALAVHPSLVKEAYEDSVKRGVRTEFLPDGRPIMRDRQHQKRYLKAYGFHNRDGGYGD